MSYERLLRRHPTPEEIAGCFDEFNDGQLRALPEWVRDVMLSWSELIVVAVDSNSLEPVPGIASALCLAFGLGRDSERNEWANDTMPFVDGEE